MLNRLLFVQKVFNQILASSYLYIRAQINHLIHMGAIQPLNVYEPFVFPG